jgi:hypothetical protein
LAEHEPRLVRLTRADIDAGPTPLRDS